MERDPYALAYRSANNHDHSVVNQSSCETLRGGRDDSRLVGIFGERGGIEDRTRSLIAFVVSGR